MADRNPDRGPGAGGDRGRGNRYSMDDAARVHIRRRLAVALPDHPAVGGAALFRVVLPALMVECGYRLDLRFRPVRPEGAGGRPVSAGASGGGVLYRAPARDAAHLFRNRVVHRCAAADVAGAAIGGYQRPSHVFPVRGTGVGRSLELAAGRQPLWRAARVRTCFGGGGNCGVGRGAGGGGCGDACPQQCVAHRGHSLARRHYKKSQERPGAGELRHPVCAPRRLRDGALVPGARSGAGPNEPSDRDESGDDVGEHEPQSRSRTALSPFARAV